MPWSRRDGLDKKMRKVVVFTQFMKVKEEAASKFSGKISKLPVGSAVDWRTVREH